MKKLKLNIQMFASTNKTANYDLPQFVGTDKPTWLGDINEAMADIDAGMHANATNISNMASDVASASATASQASQDVAGLTSTVNTLSTNVSAVTTTANNAQQTATSALNTANTANGKADTNASAITSIQSDITSINSDITSIENDISTKTKYSTTETIIGTYSDNRPIYRKVINFTNTTTDWQIIDTINNIDDVLRLSGYAYDSGNNKNPIPDYSAESVLFYVDKLGEIKKKATTYFSNKTGVVVIEYTKTTD